MKETSPFDVINVLERSGFDTKIALLNINNEAINEIEQYVCENQSILDSTSLQKDGNFRFKPGHRRFLLELPTQIQKMTEEEDQHSLHVTHTTDFSYILNMLINTAKFNSNKEPKGHRYEETIRYFATYIYIMCGKSCYDTLSANLPIPKAQTIRI